MLYRMAGIGNAEKNGTLGKVNGTMVVYNSNQGKGII